MISRLPPSASRAVLAWATVAAMVGLPIVAGWVLASPLVAAVPPLLALAGWAEYRRRRRVREAGREAERRLEAVEQLLLRVGAGASLMQACLGLPPAVGLSLLQESLAVGEPLAHAARRAAAGESDPSARLIGLTLATVAENGGPARPALLGLRRALQTELQQRRRSQAQAAQALASAAMLAVAPVGFALLIALVEPSVARFYWRESAGAACVAGAVALAGLGWWWMQRQVVAVQSGRRRRVSTFDPAVGPAVDVAAVILGAGGTVPQVVNALAGGGPEPTRHVFGSILVSARDGRLLAEALTDAVAELGSAFEPLLSALTAAQSEGAPLASVLARLADDADYRNRQWAEEGAGRLSVALVPPLVVCFLPALILGSILPLAVVSLRAIEL